jgi:hypothetical protein
MVKIDQDIDFIPLYTSFPCPNRPAEPGLPAKSTRQKLPPLTVR